MSHENTEMTGMGEEYGERWERDKDTRDKGQG
jgi:hypothetical protein